MNKSIVKIGQTDVTVKEYKGKRVVAFKDIDQCHSRPEGTARRNFNANVQHMIDGTDYFKVCANEIRTHKIMELSSKAHEDVTLITESGYLMLVKSFTDDLAWDVQRQLVNTYFTVKKPNQNMFALPKDYSSALRSLADKVDENNKLKETNAQQQQLIEEQKPKVNYYDVILSSKDAVSITKIAKDYGKTARWMNEFLHKYKVQFKQGKTWLLYQPYAMQGYTKSETISYDKYDGETGTAIHTKWTQKGRLFIYDLLKEHNVLPLIDIDNSNNVE